MLVGRVVGNIHDSPLPEGTHVETVTVPSPQLVKRIQRVRTDHGRDVGIRLAPTAPALQDGDILHCAEGNAIVVRVEPDDVIVIQPRSVLEMGVVAHALGNRHLPAQFLGADSERGEEVMIVQYDHTVVQYLEAAGVPYARERRVMATPFRHADHAH